MLEIEQLPLPERDTSKDNSILTNVAKFKVGAGSKVIFMDKEGARFGSHLFDEAKAYIKTDGSYKFKTKDGDTILDSENASGDFIQIINTALNTSSKEILTDFTFETTDYAGAFKTGNVTWNASTGLPTGGTGFIINAKGIIGVNGGSTKVAILADGTATFGGTLSAPNGTLGTITSGTITGATIQSATTGERTVQTSANGYQFYNGTNHLGQIEADGTNSGIRYRTDYHYFRNRTGTTEYAKINSSGFIIPNASAYYITAGIKMSYTGGFLKFEGGGGGDIGTKFQGSVYPNSDNSYDLGSSLLRWRHGYFEDISVDDLVVNSGGSITIDGNSGDDEEFEVVTSMRDDGGTHQWKARLLTFKKGVLTNLGSESSWRDV